MEEGKVYKTSDKRRANASKRYAERREEILAQQRDRRLKAQQEGNEELKKKIQENRRRDAETAAKKNRESAKVALNWNKPWTTDELLLVADPTIGPMELSRRLGRSITSVNHQRHRMRIKQKKHEHASSHS